MRHVNKKKSIRGAGKKAAKPQAAQAAILQPPKLGGFKAVSSFSVAEIVDLISDGPIEGLVDQNGRLLGRDIFKGIYLDNTPIQNTINFNAANPINPSSTLELLNLVARIWMDANGNFKTIDSQQRLLFGFYGLPESPTIYISPFLSPSSSASNTTHWKLADNKIEIHRTNPITNISTIFNSFETHVTTINNNYSTVGDTYRAGQSIAASNLTKLDNIKLLMQESSYALNNQTETGAVSFIIIDLGNVFFSDLNGDIAFGDDIIYSIAGIADEYATVFTQPEISNSKFTGNVRTMLILRVPINYYRSSGISLTGYYLPKDLLIALNSSNVKLQGYYAYAQNSNTVFNFSNVSCQFKDGEELQKSLNNFDKVFNDYMYESPLYGPFVLSSNHYVQRINLGQFNLGVAGLALGNQQKFFLTAEDIFGSVTWDSSTDLRGLNYSNWQDVNEAYEYESVAVTHTIENPFVDRVCVTIAVNSLSDTIEQTVTPSGVGELQAGSKIPAVVALRIQTGKITNGIKTDVKTYTYCIAGLIEGSCIIDFGSDNIDAEYFLNESVKIIEGTILKDTPLTQPFILPALVDGEEPSSTKRYVTVVKLSCETNSVLINKDIALAKVTEIIDQRFSYPFSAIAGIKLDARSFSSIPERSYDCKLKKVRIPSNYQTQDPASSLDIRYVSSATNYTTKKQIYIKDWDGTFTYGWTDNPAWILYDLLTSKRYGLGSYIDESQVNKWELYKIARFCDAVDDEGYFVGVSNGFGGLEPRFSCNIMFKEQTKVYDAINVIANLFRGVVFFGGSEIHFLDDRPRTPIALFNNSNAKEGVFNYGNVRRDLQFNTVEVVYLDRFDNYKTKVEYVQDEQDIRKRGVFKTTINTLGVTSRAMSRRIGQHIIYQTTKENQTVSFDAGLESLLCRPGDLIIVEDEMKTRASNYGRILEVDVVNKKLRIDNPFISGEYTGFVTVYSPTGYSTSEELDQISQINRTRVQQFSITGLLGNSALSGLYKFSGYTSGFNNPNYPSQFPLYTGTGSAGRKLFCYYNTGATGFVFATGLAFQNDITYDKFITNTGVFYGADISSSAIGNSGNYTGFTYNVGANKRAAPSGAISGAINWDSTLYPPTNGILDSEIDIYNISQITKMSLTGYDNTIDYGSFIYLNQNDPNVAFLPAVKAGSVYRIERKSSSDQIYKIISIRENSQNEYNITASRYDTGKFETIEKSITQDFLENTYYTGIVTVGNVQVAQVATPQIAAFSGFDQTSLGFKLTGRWTSGVNATGFSASISNSLAGYFESITTNQTGVQFTGLTNIGNWNLSVTALAKSPNINSSAANTGTFVAYSGADVTTITKPAVVGFSIE